MRSVEISAPSLEDARRAAAFQLGVGEDELEIEVLQAPRKLLGLISSGQCRIRATYDEERAAGAETPTDIETPREAPAGEQVPEATGALEVEVAEPEAIWEQTERPPPPTPPTEQPADAKRAVAERAKQLTEEEAAQTLELQQRRRCDDPLSTPQERVAHYHCAVEHPESFCMVACASWECPEKYKPADADIDPAYSDCVKGLL